MGNEGGRKKGLREGKKGARKEKLEPLFLGNPVITLDLPNILFPALPFYILCWHL